MEAIGLGVGVAGLAGLFSSCIDCFELVQRGRYLGREYLLLETKFANQRLRLLSWGRACGFVDSDSYDERFDEEEVRSCIEATLVHLITLFKNGRELKIKYGLKNDSPKHNMLTAASSALHTLVPLPNTTNLGQKLQELKERMNRTQKDAKFTGTVRWAIEDKAKFCELVQHIKDLIDDLEDLTKWLNISGRQRWMIQCEVESISDISVLEIMEEVRCGKTDAVSDAASLRIWKLRDQYLNGEQGNRPLDPNQSSQASVNSTDGEWDDMANDAQNWPAVAVNTRYQLLHRVFCQHEPTSIFLDTPSYSTWNSDRNQWIVLDIEHPTCEPRASHLRGRRTIPDLDAYLTQNWELLFVVFRNYKCCHDTEQRNDSDSLAFDQSVYLVSEDLCSGLRELCQRTLDVPPCTDFEPKVELQAPYLWYYHSRKLINAELNDAGREPKNSQCVRILVDYISESMTEEYSTVEALLSKQMISWPFLKYLYTRGDIIIQKDGKGKDHYQGHELTSWPIVCDSDEGSAHLKLKIARPRFRNAQEGLLPISLLPVLPFHYVEDCSREQLEHRGEVFWSCRYQRLVAYKGLATDSAEFVRESRFMVDASAYNQHLSDNDTSTKRLRLNDDLGSDAMASDQPPAGNFLLLLPPTIYGFDMRERQWKELVVSNIAQPIWNKHDFDHVILDPEKKELLQAATMSMVTNGNINVQSGDKSDRLVLLFFGNAGTGKTVTAEAVAESTERPIYRITSNEIGTDAKVAERLFENILHFGTTWNCVVLLENADVFLGERSLTDMKHNALVSVFLHFLDRYNGTLILTSNRIARFDRPFTSHIHLVLYFPPLDQPLRGKIWKSLIHLCEGLDEYDKEEIYENIELLSIHEMNGRKISNTIKTAQKLAHFKNSGLNLEILQHATNYAASKKMDL